MISVVFIVACSFIWVGFVGAISFMESWLKFRAPNLTMPVGLGIGKLVFSALNKVEWGLAVIISINLFFYESELKSLFVYWFMLIVAILVLQTAWLLPLLNKRVQTIISGKKLPQSSAHYYFVGAEFIKLLLLIFFGGGLLRAITI